MKKSWKGDRLPLLADRVHEHAAQRIVSVRFTGSNNLNGTESVRPRRICRGLFLSVLVVTAIERKTFSNFSAGYLVRYLQADGPISLSKEKPEDNVNGICIPLSG